MNFKILTGIIILAIDAIIFMENMLSCKELEDDVFISKKYLADVRYASIRFTGYLAILGLFAILYGIFL